MNDSWFDELDGLGLDLAVDGADAVDRDLRLIKGAGGALVREKIVAAAARRFIVVADSSKLVDPLAGVLPVEIVQFGSAATLASLSLTCGAAAGLRPAGGVPFVTDNGNLIADVPLQDGIADPEALAERLEAIPGVVGHGLFLGMADLVLAARPDGTVEELTAR